MRTREALRVIRAVAERRSTDGFAPPSHGLPAAPLRVVIGARGERFNRFASGSADGVFLGGIPRSMLPDTIEWARSVRPIDIGIHVNTVTGERQLEHLRPALIWTLADAPALTRERLGIDSAQLDVAIRALQSGDDSLARQVVTDDVVHQLVVVGDAATVTAGLHGYISEFDPDTIGLLLHPDGDPVAAIIAAGDALRAVNPVPA
jgi:hypothetical protein